MVVDFGSDYVGGRAPLDALSVISKKRISWDIHAMKQLPAIFVF